MVSLAEMFTCDTDACKQKQQLKEKSLCSQHLIKLWEGGVLACTLSWLHIHMLSYVGIKFSLNLDQDQDFHPSTPCMRWCKSDSQCDPCTLNSTQKCSAVFMYQCTWWSKLLTDIQRHQVFAASHWWQLLLTCAPTCRNCCEKRRHPASGRQDCGSICAWRDRPHLSAAGPESLLSAGRAGAAPSPCQDTWVTRLWQPITHCHILW